MLKFPELFKNGALITQFGLEPEIQSLVESEAWASLDQRFWELTKPSGALFQFLREYHDFSAIEFIISIRDAQNEWEEDGIWHNDGSRVFSFSLSLTLSPVEGGGLGIRKEGQESFLEIPTPPFGGIILFLTGVYGFEHKIHQVKKGRRIIIAGWCT